MSAYRTDNTYIFLTTVLILVLSVLACNGSYLSAAPTTPAPTVVKAVTTPTTALTTVEVIAGEALHVRNKPLGTVIGYLYSGDTVTLTGKCQTNWAQIEWGGGTGWVNAKYLSDNKCNQ